MKSEFNCTLSLDEVGIVVRKFFKIPDQVELSIDYGNDRGLILFFSSGEEKMSDVLKSIEVKLYNLEGILEEELDEHVSVRSYNRLYAARVKTFGDLITWTETDLLKIRNFGKHSLKEIKKLLTSKGLKLKDE